MIATHTPKMFNARLKTKAISSRISGTITPSLISSQTVNMRRELWAAPTNAAYMKHWREQVAALTEDHQPDIYLPEIEDTQLKQILLPMDDSRQAYVSATPITSMGVIHELYQRLYEMNLPYRKWVIQPTPAAWANHGEALLVQGGAVRMLRRGPAKITQGNWQGDFVQLTAHCERMNISSGMVAVGFPAITAIGGLVHALERSIGEKIEFAFGIKAANWVSSVAKMPTYKGSYGSFTGRTKGGAVNIKPGYSTEEITANCEIVLLLRTRAYMQPLADKLIKISRLAGGSLFDTKISIVNDGTPPEASYLLDASADIIRKRQNKDIDSLQAALEMYGMDGEWNDGEWYQPRNGYTLNQTGYAFLEQPKQRKGTRGNYDHVWAESIYSLITQGSMTDSAWWVRDSTSNSVLWKCN